MITNKRNYEEWQGRSNRRVTRRTVTVSIIFLVLLLSFLPVSRINVSLSAGYFVNASVVDTIPVKCCPHGMAFDTSNGYVYATDSTPNGTVSVIDTKTNSVVSTISVGSYPEDIAFDSSNGDLYVTNSGSGSVSVINATTNVVVKNISVGSSPSSVTFDPSNGGVYVADLTAGCASQPPGDVSVIDGATNTFLGNIRVGSGPDAVAFDSWNGDIYVADICGGISVIDGSTNTDIGTVPIGLGSYDVAFDSQNGCLYVAGYAVVNIVNGTTNSIVDTISSSPKNSPWGVAFDPSNGLVYVANEAYNVSIIDGATNLVVANATVGVGPYGLAFDPENGYMYVANSGSGTVSVIATTISTTRFSTSTSDSISSTSYSTTSIQMTSHSASSISTSYFTSSTPPSFVTSVVNPTGQPVEIGVIGNISSNQISNMSLSGNSTITLSFTLSGTQESQGSATIAIPKKAVPSGETPLVYMNGALALGQSYYSDQSNYYVSFAIQSGTHQISLVFSQSSSIGTDSTYSSSSRSSPTPSSKANDSQSVTAEAVGALAVAALSFALIRGKAKDRLHPSTNAKQQQCSDWLFLNSSLRIRAMPF